MLERRRILDLHRTGSAQVLVTLVSAEGSSYRRPGARLLLAAGGAYAGTISGGCLEAEVTRKANWLIRNGPVVERYSTLFDDTAEIPFGLGCGGTVDLLFEPAGTPEADALFQALELSLEGAESIVTTWLPRHGRGMCREVRTLSGELIFASPQIVGKYQGLPSDSGQTYREHLETPQRLIVLGAGDDAKPVVRIAALLGWTVVVADGRAQLTRPERFPEAQTVQKIRNPQAAAVELGITPKDAIVLMTHSYEQDRDCLGSVLSAPTQSYVGVLGARHRTALLVAETAAALGQPITACCQRIHAPIGLDLGGDGPETIALAIVAEIQACRHRKLAASRRLSPDEVARQLERGDATRYHSVQCAVDSVP